MIEMVVALGIFSLLVALTVPSMRSWIANTKVRAVADALQNGLRLAQTESMRRSRQVVLALTNNATPQNGGFSALANGAYWAVQTIPAMLDASETAVVIGSGVLTSAGSSVHITGPAAVCFNSVGRLVAQSTTGVAGATCTAPTAVVNGVPMVVYNITLTNADHPLNVEVALGGQLHLCDANQTLSAANPYGC
jgi:type IV fimbrial biogenesis protein FimT